MKRPWLLTQAGQRITMLIATLLTIFAIPLAYQQIAVEAGRVPAALDPKNVDYCQIDQCGTIEKLAGLEVVGIEKITETEFGTTVSIRLLNHGQLTGSREIWAELRTQSGKRIESMRQVVELNSKGIQLLELFFTGSRTDFESGILLLGF